MIEGQGRCHGKRSRHCADLLNRNDVRGSKPLQALTGAQGRSGEGITESAIRGSIVREFAPAPRSAPYGVSTRQVSELMKAPGLEWIFSDVRRRQRA
jgi:hypothetical protein